jgi:putative sporulation protein YtxC
LIEIQFQRQDDAKRLHSFLDQLLDLESSYKYILQNEDFHIVQFQRPIHSKKEEYSQMMKDALCQFVMKIKLNDWLKEMLIQKYHYRDEVEQQQILDIIYSVIEGKNKELAVFLPKFSMKNYLMDHINQLFNESKVFSFDSFVTFRLRPFINELRKYVELSLDEYKMEQEYQMFIQILREFLSDREPRYEQLHLLFADDEITFYDHNFSEIKRAELSKMIDRKLLINHPIYIDSTTIAPLLSIAPMKIHFYTKEPEKPIIRTISNIFEERLIIEKPVAFEKLRVEKASNFNKKI